MILVRYVLREHFAPFVAALLVIVFLFVIDFFVNLLDSVLNKGLPGQVVLEIFVLNLAWILALAVPMAVLVSGLMAFGRLSADHEITAVKAAGYPPFLLMRPVLLVAALFMVLLGVFNNWVLPEANHRAAALMSDVSRKKPSAFVEAGRLLTQFPGVQIWIDRIDNNTGRLHGVQIFEVASRGTPRVILADSAELRYEDQGATLMLKMLSGENHAVDDEDAAKYFRILFSRQDLAIRNVDDRLERRERTHRGDREMPVEDMLEVVKKAHDSYFRLVRDNAAEVWSDLITVGLSVVEDYKAPPAKEVYKPTRGTLTVVQSQERTRGRLVDRVSERLEQERKRTAQYQVEIHKKFSIPVACLVFVLVGAPLGIMARRGGIGTGVVYSLAFFILYWACLIGGENLADRLLIDPILAMWLPNIVLGPLGLYVTWRMTRDNYAGNPFWVRMRLAWVKLRNGGKLPLLPRIRNEQA